ncbi:MAG: TonB C-terminal domain-containing protein, partial [Desulfovibrio sp.]|nr:TonB C-terminal domain-containing protein [Desulfovibrio sp.]
AAKPASSSSGAKAQDKYDSRFQKYISTVVWKLRNSMYIPAQTKPGTYHATAQVRLNSAGKILDESILKGSGDALLDKYVLQGIRRAGSVAPPPAGLGDTLDLTFTLTRQ